MRALCVRCMCVVRAVPRDARTYMKAPVSSLSVSSCFSSTVMAWSQSTAASSTSVVLFMYTPPKKSVARKPGGTATEVELLRVDC